MKKYGIKEVADVTLYRIDRKDETYESQRKISISSILKGALTKEMVFPLDEDGKGSADGYEAYVFKDADVLTHFNYDCDDVIEVKGSSLFIDNADPAIVSGTYTAGQEVTGEDLTKITNYLTDGTPANIFGATNVALLSLVEKSSNRSLRDRLAELIAKGYSVTADGLQISKVKSRGTVSEDAGKSGADIAAQDFIVMKSEAVTPLVFDNITEAAFEAAVAANGGEVTKEEGTITSAYITFIVPKDATPEEIMGAFQAQQKRLYEDLGIIVRFTQPVRDGSTTTTKFSGTITIGFTYDDDDDEATEAVAATVTLTFDEATVDGSTELLIEAAKGGSLTAAQATSLIAAVANNADVTTAYNPAGAEGETILTVTSVTVVEDAPAEYQTFLVTFSATLAASDEMETGIFELTEDTVGHWSMDRDNAIGTHEFSYPEQICMIFAKNQNLITKAGTRFAFAEPNLMFGGFDFDDNFAAAPNSKERVVVVGLAGRISENLYDFEEIDAAIKEMKDTIEAKAYDITYTDYAELVVEDEMGYYLPQQLGGFYDKKTESVTFFDENTTYGDFASARKGIDLGIYNAVNTWGDDTHYSINDAIDALK